MLAVFVFALGALFCLICCLYLLKMEFFAAFLISLGVFVLFHFLYVVFFWLFSLSVPRDRPLEKQNPVCRFGIGSLASILDYYLWVRPVITGTEKLPTDSRFLFVCNHRSFLDPIVVADRLRAWNIAFISKPSNMKIPLASRVAYAAGFLAIDRDNDRNALKTILTAADYMKRDLCSIAIYPEGHRSKTGELLPFHAGSFKTAQKAKVPVVVACVHGQKDAGRPKLFARRVLCLDILELIPAEEVCAMRTDALSDHVRSIIQQDLDQAAPAAPVSGVDGDGKEEV